MATFLLVDDSSVARLAVAKRLQDEGMDVRVVGSAAEARRADVATCDCAIIDVDLEDGNGTELAAELRASNPALRIAFFTAGETPDPESKPNDPFFAKTDIDPLVEWAIGASGDQPPPTK